MDKQNDVPTLHPLLPSVATWLIAAVLIGAASALLRYQLIEPLSWAETCEPQRWQGWCVVRSATIELFQQQRIGWFATACALTGLVTGVRLFAGLALLSGAASMVLYAVEPGAFGALLGLLSLVRAPGDERSRGQTAATAMAPASKEKPSA